MIGSDHIPIYIIGLSVAISAKQLRIINASTDAVKAQFQRQDWRMGKDIVEEDWVNITDVERVNETRYQIQAEVEDVETELVQLIFNLPNSQQAVISGTCSCLSGETFGRRYCEHMAAAYLGFISWANRSRHSLGEVNFIDGVADSETVRSLYDELCAERAQTKAPERQALANWESWIETVVNKSGADNVKQHQFCYQLQFESGQFFPRIGISVFTCYPLKKGGLSKPKLLSTLHNHTADRAMTADDRYLLDMLGFEKHSYHNNASMSPNPKVLGHALPTLIDSGRCYWFSIDAGQVISLGNSRQLQLSWQQQQDGRYRLGYLLDGKLLPDSVVMINSDPCWYLDQETWQCGPLAYVESTHLLRATQALTESLGSVPQQAVQHISQELKKLGVEPTNLPQPVEYIQHDELITPQINLRLAGRTLQSSFDTEAVKNVPIASLSFTYIDKTLPLTDGADSIHRLVDGKVLVSPRHHDWEKNCVERFAKLGLSSVDSHPDFLPTQKTTGMLLVATDYDDQKALAEITQTLEKLAEAENWVLTIDKTYPYTEELPIDNWYGDIQDQDNNWFDLDLGIMVNEQKISLLPILLSLLKTDLLGYNKVDIQALPDETEFKIKLKKNKQVTLPLFRIRGILVLLYDLNTRNPLNKNNQLTLSTLQAQLLVELEQALSASEFNWFGGERLLVLGQKLNDFAGIKAVKLPSTFKATLRPYQQQGVNWLQFLREYGLSGVLADEMGLGKTIQTLAHLSIEKSKRRLKKPCLLIAPTSLVFNWEAEARKFAPNLTILCLQGNQRQQHFDQINQVDLVISTYPLLSRDKEVLEQHDYYYIILDEAQQIKNSRAKSTAIVQQLKTDYKLCLTGTPMENHLGELWSLYNFALPGLLGTQREFTQVFRHPIEREGLQERYELLNARIKPFLLRRRKEDVVKELPAKTELIRHVEISGEQRDLYETIRLSMDKKVRKAIQANGFNKSQIIILDALLKLRQVCCAPKLVKLGAETDHIDSAKLTDLMAFLPDLVAEGRKVIIFSSFTSMLSLIAEQLTVANINFVTLTGQTKDRKTPINDFQQGNVPVFLISLKAGGVGLNLTAADTVIHFDPWWNPAAEQQATARAHRIGQDKPVFVYKLISTGSVEEKILSLQDKKLKLISGVVESKKQSNEKLTQDDLQVLFEPLPA